MWSRRKGTGVEELAAALRAQRHLLERLLFRMIAAQRLLEARDTRFVPWACEEIERAVEHVRGAEAQRSAVVSRLAAARGVPEVSLTLESLLHDTPEPFRFILSDHRRSLVDLMSRIDDAAAGLIAAGLDELPAGLRPEAASR